MWLRGVKCLMVCAIQLLLGDFGPKWSLGSSIVVSVEPIELYWSRKKTAIGESERDS
jgi:hypothetical protein